MTDHRHLDLELVDLLTADVDPITRRARLDALRECEVCRARYDELAAGLGDVLAVAPAATPPLGFETRVMNRLAAARPAAPAAAPVARWRPSWWLAAAAVLIAVAASALTAVALGGGNDGGDALALVRTGTDDTVGSVSFTETGDDEAVMVVALLDAPADIAYRCRMRLADGTVVDSAAWPATARGAWVLDVPGSVGDVERVEIIRDGTDNVWAAATP